MTPAVRAFDLSGLRIEFHGTPEGCADRLEDVWGQFGARKPGVPFLQVRIEPSGGSGPPPRTISAQTMRSRFAEGSAEFAMDDGACRVAGNTATITVPTRGGDHQYFTLVNLLLPAIAWRLMVEGGGVLHAAGAVLDGRAFLVVGPENAGKSTWVALAKSAGALPLSDDVIFVRCKPGSVPEAISSPFRVKDHGSIGPGNWPIAAILHPRHGPSPRVEPVSGLAARASLLANLLYVTEDLDRIPNVDATLDVLTRRVPNLKLTFAKDASFVELLRGLT